MYKDLSNLDGPITDIFEGSREIKFSVEDANFYRENGYLSGVRVLDDFQVGALNAELGRIKNLADTGLFYEFHHNESGEPGNTLFHALGAWRVSPAFHDLIYHKPFVSAAEQLLGGPVRFWHDQIFSKPAGDGGVVAWHQDYSYWTRT
ncbi:MAG TPA: phytanoyl-CoA dioxygenase family protein, partial [Pyrinomonadaceae bacterium]|nr:phytanoyl-CoA dioxygenase family protein [Pyrinomonadaceae bacterium]